MLSKLEKTSKSPTKEVFFSTKKTVSIDPLELEPSAFALSRLNIYRSINFLLQYSDLARLWWLLVFCLFWGSGGFSMLGNG